MNIDANLYQAHEGAAIDLAQWATQGKPLCKSKKGYDKALQDQIEQLSAQQRLLYASDRHALLLIFQAMDTAGKDGAIQLSAPQRARAAARLSVANHPPPARARTHRHL